MEVLSFWMCLLCFTWLRKKLLRFVFFINLAFIVSCAFFILEIFVDASECALRPVIREEAEEMKAVSGFPRTWLTADKLTN